jgi:hypothetical protein
MDRGSVEVKVNLGVLVSSSVSVNDVCCNVPVVVRLTDRFTVGVNPFSVPVNVEVWCCVSVSLDGVAVSDAVEDVELLSAGYDTLVDAVGLVDKAREMENEIEDVAVSRADVSDGSSVEVSDSVHIVGVTTRVRDLSVVTLPIDADIVNVSRLFERFPEPVNEELIVSDMVIVTFSVRDCREELAENGSEEVVVWVAVSVPRSVSVTLNVKKDDGEPIDVLSVRVEVTLVVEAKASVAVNFCDIVSVGRSDLVGVTVRVSVGDVDIRDVFVLLLWTTMETV